MKNIHLNTAAEPAIRIHVKAGARGRHKAARLLVLLPMALALAAETQAEPAPLPDPGHAAAVAIPPGAASLGLPHQQPQHGVSALPGQTVGGTPTVLTLPASPTAYTRWQTSLAAFAKSDQERHPAQDGVLFVGSSTIRMWSQMQQDFRQVPVIINRGFGGSTMADCSTLVRELVIQYKPRQVMVYAGDNDLAEGRSPADVLKSFMLFVQNVRAELPGTRIAYISIKPSPSRAALMPKIREANALIAGYVQTLPDTRYIDIFTPMLSADGQPRPELFLRDQLHLNDAGYRLWQSVIAGHLPASQLAAPPAQPQVVRVTAPNSP